MMNTKANFCRTVIVVSCSLVAAYNPTPVLAVEPNLVAQISRMRVFDQRLVPIGGQPSSVENRALADALKGYSARQSPDDFAAVTAFLESYPDSPWRAALLIGLGLDYYKTAHYSRALEAWQSAWTLGQKATDARGKFLADRAVSELAGLYSRLGRMAELRALLKSIEGRFFLGGASEKINLAHEALAMMEHRPEVSFRCGPLALLSIKRCLNLQTTNDLPIYDSASTQRGFSLPQVAQLSKAVGLDYQMAFREKDGEFVVPSVVHWKVGHYAALVRQVGNQYLLEDPTFGNTVWATKQALEAETSGYFLIPPGPLPHGWRRVAAEEGGDVWGKGITSDIDPDNYTPEDWQGGSCPMENAVGMAISRVHLGIVNLQIRDTPVGYAPPVGPPVLFTVRYNHRDYVQEPEQIPNVFGPNWTHDWNGFIGDNPLTPLADVKYFVRGGGARTFTGFNTNTQAFSPQQFEQSRLTRTGPGSYEMLFPNGSKKIFGLRSGNRVYLTEIVDPSGNAVTLTYDGIQRLTSITDAIGQVTTLAYEHTSEVGLITKVTDPFGRFATFDYGEFELQVDTDNNPNTPPAEITVYALTNITDVIGLTSQFKYIVDTNMFIFQMTTPYGATSFSRGQGGGPNGTTRFVETVYADGSRERVEFNQNTNGIAFSDPPGLVPQGGNAFNQWLHARNTFYWSRQACAQGYGDYSQAKIYHWLHTPNIATAAGILESTKEPLERRVWYNYPGQSAPYLTVGTSDQPTRIGRVLDDGTTQLYSYGYNRLGHLTNSIDPVGRELSYLYASNEIDLLEIRQTRGTNNQLLFLATYNNQHRPLTITDAAGQTTTNTYNTRGQLLSTTNPKGETTTFTYNTNGYLIAVDGPLPGTNDTFVATYDSFGRIRTRTDESGYSLTFDYDAMDRLTRITYPDSTFSQYTYDRLDLVVIRDSSGRETLLEYDNMRQLRKQADPLGRVTRFQWCSCGSPESLIDPMGRITKWETDIQGRRVRKQYGDGSTIRYAYEKATSRLRQVTDEQQQITQYGYNRDNTLSSIAYANAVIPTPGVSFAYDPDYQRLVSMTDGIGTTLYAYNPITGSPTFGAGNLASIDGPLANDTITYGYDKPGRRVSIAVNEVAEVMTYDPGARVVGETNALGTFTYGYEDSSGRLKFQLFPNGQSTELNYFNNFQDRTLQRITHQVNVTPISEFIYGRNVPAGRISTWSQQAGALPPSLYTFGYDAVNQLLLATVTNAGSLINSFAYTYDQAGNRLTEQVGATNYTATYNALNQLSTGTAPGASHTNEWDAMDRLVAVNTGNQRTEFTYDGLSRLASIRLLTNGVQASLRRFVWCGREICEERDAAGAVTKRFFDQGIKIEAGPNTGNYYYTRDHLGSIREVTDGAGAIRARYAYDPFGRRTKLTGDVEADFGFAGMFWCVEANLNLTHYRAYDPGLGRWLSRDPLEDAEFKEGFNLFAYVLNNPVNHIDPAGLCLTTVDCTCMRQPETCAAAGITAGTGAQAAQRAGPAVVNAMQTCAPRVAQVFDTLEPRIIALEASYPEVVPWLQNWRELRHVLPAWYHEMIHFEREFVAIVEIYMARTGMTFNQAWNYLVNRLGVNPDDWL